MANRPDSRPSTSDGRPRHPHPSSRQQAREQSPPTRDDFRGHVRNDNRFTSDAHYSYPVNDHHHHYYPRPLASQAYSLQRPFRRQSWPAHSFVEEEKASLAKEAFPSTADEDTTDAPSRGTIDQQPIILDAAIFSKRSSASPNKERGSSRRVRLDHVNIPPPPQQKSSKPKRVQIPESPSELSKTTEFVDFAERHSTPYAFTPKREPRASPTDSGYSSSSDFLLAGKRKQAGSLNDLAMSDALRGQGKLRESNHHRRASGLSHDGDQARLSSSLYREDRESAYPFSPSDTLRRLERGSTREPAATRPRLAAVKAEALHSPRRSSDTATTLPRPHLEETPRSPSLTKPTPLATLAARNSTYEKISDSRSDIDSRPVSPVSTASTLASSPPHSPITSNNRYRDDLRISRSSAYTSHPGSRRGSRASSPVDSMRRSSTCPNLAEERFHRPCRSTDSTYSLDDVRPRDAYAPYPPAPSSALPYPVDDVGLMPSEDVHRYWPSGSEKGPSPIVPAKRDEAPSPTFDRRAANGGLAPARPRLPSRRTADGALPTLRTSSQITEDTYNTSPNTSKSPAYHAPRQPPPCPRPHSTRTYDDWYTLDGLPEFDICPDCLHNNFDSTRLRDYFRRAKPKDSKQKTKCDFANEWVRLAWLMTQQQHRRDLDLVYAVAKIGAHDGPCPGNHDDARTWYTLVDKNGERIDHFDVCRTDVKRIEALMPQLHDVFVKAYGTTKVRKCDLQTESHRFAKYLDVLYGIVEKAEIKRKPPDVQQFVNFVRQRAQITECRRGKALFDKHWHIIPQLPEFTVCEECYTDVIWPAIEDGYGIATKFQKTPQLIYNDHSGQDEGASCQLYSPRMRRIFIKAVKSDNFKYLIDSARERRGIEQQIKIREHGCKRLQKQLEKDGVKSSGMEGLNQELEHLADKWKKIE